MHETVHETAPATAHVVCVCVCARARGVCGSLAPHHVCMCHLTPVASLRTQTHTRTTHYTQPRSAAQCGSQLLDAACPRDFRTRRTSSAGTRYSDGISPAQVDPAHGGGGRGGDTPHCTTARMEVFPRTISRNTTPQAVCACACMAVHAAGLVTCRHHATLVRKISNRVVPGRINCATKASQSCVCVRTSAPPLQHPSARTRDSCRPPARAGIGAPTHPPGPPLTAPRGMAGSV